MSNNWSMNTVSENWGMDGMGNWGMDSMGNNWGMDSMGNNWGMDGMSNWGSSSVVWLSLISDISDETIVVVGVILDMLDSAIRKVDRVFSINNTGSIIVLSLVESSTRVVISNSIGVRVWGRLSKVISNISSLDWGMVSWGSMDNWGMISWGSVDGVVDWGMDSVGNNWGSVVEEWGSMDSMVNWGMDGVDSMGDNGISSVKSVGGISNNSSVGTESLALGGRSVFSLVWLADRLMADLSVSISIDWSVGTVVHWGNGSRDWGGEDWGMDSGMVSNSMVHQTKVGTGGGHDSAQTQESLHVC